MEFLGYVSSSNVKPLYLVHVDGSDKESKVLLGETCDEGHPSGDFKGAKGYHKDTHPNTHP